MNLGITRSGNETSFALYSKHATVVLLRLFEVGREEPIHEVELKREGDVWRVSLENLSETFEYSYRCDGPYDPKKGHLFNKETDLVDPYAREVNRNSEWNSAQKPPRGVYRKRGVFNWEDDSRPLIPEEELILYEMHVRGFTQDPSGQVGHPGTFLGMIEKIPHLKELGVNGVELLPVHTFYELGDHFNYWGYATANFFSVMSPYGTPEDFKVMVKAFHHAGMEVILDVVYNHTNEGSYENYYYSFRGIDNATYYIVDENGYHNYSGCGNTFNCNHPAAQELILDSLRYFVKEYRIDGFRFDLAPILTRGEDGKPLEKPPLIEKISRDPILGPTKLIAEAWDATGLYQVGSFPSYRFGQWNDQYRDDIRKFIRGGGDLDRMKKRIIGSPDLFDSPRKSYNFVTIHDGFSLRDLVSYDEKHNEGNKERNQDGMNDNLSWNCGVEGETEDEKILFLRVKQMRNFFLALLISDGIPMLRMGDEYGHTQGGNNNTWCQDNKLSYFLWDELAKNRSLFTFVSKVISIRKKYLQKRKEIQWLDAPFLIFLIDDHILAIFNPTDQTFDWSLPDKKWRVIIDTHEMEEKEIVGNLKINPYSSILSVAT